MKTHGERLSVSVRLASFMISWLSRIFFLFSFSFALWLALSYYLCLCPIPVTLQQLILD